MNAYTNMTASVNTSGDTAFDSFKNQLLVAIPSKFRTSITTLLTEAPKSECLTS